MKTVIKLERKDKVDAARFYVFQSVKVYGQLSQFHTDQFSETVPTACTDGQFITWGQSLEKWSSEEVRFVLLHETLHCVNKHLWRFDPTDPDAQKACDYEINLFLVEKAQKNDWKIRMPKDGLLEYRFANMCAEDILQVLKGEKNSVQHQNQDQGQGQDQDRAQSQAQAQDQKQGQEQDQEQDQEQGQGQGQEQGQGQGQDQDQDYNDPCGSFSAPAKIEQASSQSSSQPSGQNPTSGHSDPFEEKWSKALIQASLVNKLAKKGDMPAELERAIADSLASPPNWESEMVDFAKKAISQKNDWTQPARRHAWQKVIYPRKKADQVGLILLIRDTSGSIGERELSAFNALGESCLAETNCSAILADCDVDVHHQWEVNPGEIFPSQSFGGGGTDFRPVFVRAQELIDEGREVCGIIYLTDLDGEFPEQAPEVPTLWLCTTDKVAPFGRTVKVIVR